jgi:hypothetical protein
VNQITDISSAFIRHADFSQWLYESKLWYPYHQNSWDSWMFIPTCTFAGVRLETGQPNILQPGVVTQ